MKAEHINSFLASASSVIASMCGAEATFERPFLRDTAYSLDELGVMIGVTGNLRGQFIMSMTKQTARTIASRMMGGMPVLRLDEISLSAIGELGNMIAGNAARLLGDTGVAVDIAPPAVLEGSQVKISSRTPTIAIPLTADFGQVELALSLAE